MNRLIDNDLLYGRLMTVSQPHLVERYNKALVAFGYPASKLEEFEIDRTGFSPQVADELGDPDYLDPHGVNRRFIILTPAQVDLPVVHTQFSNTGRLMHEFFSSNMRTINALTIKDVIYGEIEESVSRVTEIEDLLGIEQVEFKVLSADDTIGKAAELRSLVDRLKTEPNAWRDDPMLERMVGLAKVTGDIRENTLVPDQVIFRHDAFWTSHFGGCYIFLDDKMTTVIGDPSAPGFRRSRPWQVSYLPIQDRGRVYRFLVETGRLDAPRASWLEPSGFIDRRADVLLHGLIHDADPGLDQRWLDSVWLQTWTHRNAALVNRDGALPFLNAAKRELAQTGQVDMREAPEGFRFMLVRAEPGHRDAWLVNRLVSEYAPRDFVSRYVFDKQGFYADYAGYSEAYRHYVVETIRATYLKDKEGFRSRYYGL